MPNWCKNDVTFRGDPNALNALRSLIGSDTSPISFERILPTPEPLCAVEAGSMELGYKVKYTGRWRRILRYAWVPDHIETRESLIDYLHETKPQTMAAAERYKQNVDQFGYPHWVDWRWDKWGTKWDVHPDRLDTDMGNRYITLSFATAWSPPSGIHRAIAALIDANMLDVAMIWRYEEPGNGLYGRL